MKKSLALVLALALVFAMAVPAFATEAKYPTATIGTSIVQNEEGEIEYAILLGNENSEILSGVFEITFDNEKVDVKYEDDEPVVNGSLIKGLIASNVEAATPNVLKMAWANSSKISKAGTFLTVTFVLKDAEFKGELAFELEVAELIGEDTSTPVEFNIENEVKTITIGEEEPVPTEEPTEEPTGDPSEPPRVGGVTMVAVAVVSAVAGLGALGFRKKD